MFGLLIGDANEDVAGAQSERSQIANKVENRTERIFPCRKREILAGVCPVSSTRSVPAHTAFLHELTELDCVFHGRDSH